MTKPPSPYLELVKLQEDLNRLVGDLSSQLTGDCLHGAGHWVPNVDLEEDADAVIVQVEVPGIPPNHLRVVCHGGSLQISGEKKPPLPRGEAHFLCLERSYGKFSRVIYLNTAVDVEGAGASLQNGILRIILPKIVDRRKLERLISIEKLD